jgi:hypothetical protein
LNAESSRARDDATDAGTRADQQHVPRSQRGRKPVGVALPVAPRDPAGGREIQGRGLQRRRERFHDGIIGQAAVPSRELDASSRDGPVTIGRM